MATGTVHEQRRAARRGHHDARRLRRCRMRVLEPARRRDRHVDDRVQDQLPRCCRRVARSRHGRPRCTSGRRRSSSRPRCATTPAGWSPRSPRHRPSCGRVPDQAHICDTRDWIRAPTAQTVGHVLPRRRDARARQAIRRPRRPSTASTWWSPTVRCTGCSARTVRARPRSCGSSPRCCAPTPASALVDGIDVCRDPDGVRRRIGLTGQYAAVEERLTGRENMQYVGRLFHMPKPERRRSAARSCSSGSIWSTPPTGSSRATRVACGGGSTSR